MLTLTSQVEAEIRAEGEKSFPGECCGILLGREEAVIRILPVQNARESEERHHRFLIEPEDLMKAEKSARRQGLAVLGFYHSHPNAPAKPSEYDLNHALPFYLYLILSVPGGQAEELAAWSLTLDRAEFLPAEYTILK